MKTRVSFFLVSFAITGFILLPGYSFAQQKSDEQAKAKKTITIHVTKEVDGNTVVIDTTIVTDGDFDTDVFLEGKGITKDMPQEGQNIEKNIIIRHPGEDSSLHRTEHADTIMVNDERVIILQNDDEFDLPAPPPPHMGMPFDPEFRMHPGFSQKQGPPVEAIIEGMSRSFGLGDVMPFGEMKKVVVKKKRHGKKVIITFEDRDEAACEHGNKDEERVMIYKNDDNRSSPHKEVRVIVLDNPDQKTVIDKEVDHTDPGKQEVKQPKQVIIIKEEKIK
ncbi:MAG: hypothetical protein WCI92_05040 [Bacteroidota bacterium]